MWTLVVAMKLETLCNPSCCCEPTSKKIWEAIQMLFASMNEVQEVVASRLGSKTKVVFFFHHLVSQVCHPLMNLYTRC